MQASTLRWICPATCVGQIFSGDEPDSAAASVATMMMMTTSLPLRPRGASAGSVVMRYL